MFEVLDAERIRALALPPGPVRYGIVEMRADADGSWEWLATFHHDLEAALRSFRYLAEKAKAAYDPADPRGQKVLASIDRHLATVENLKTTLVDRLIPPA